MTPTAGMPRIRRATAIVAQLLMLQFIALGSGVACANASPSNRAPGSAAAMTMAGFGHEHHAPHSPAMPGCPGNSGMPCGLPGAPSTCVGMAQCAPVAAIASALTLPVSPRLRPQSDRRAPPSPPSRTVAPELPPPRA